MFNLSSTMQGTIRYNGVASTEAKTCNITRKASPLNKSSRNQSLDLKQKLNDRLPDKRKHADIRDPYVFSDSEQKTPSVLVRKAAGVSKSSRNSKCDVSQPDYEDKITAHSIISKTSPTQNKEQPQNLSSPHHEILQRIQVPHGPCETYHIDCHPYQKHWFSAKLELLETTEGPREARMKLTKSELRRRLTQIKKSTAIREQFRPVLPNCSLPKPTPPTSPQTAVHSQFIDCDRLLARRHCETEACKQQALPCSRFCTGHIMNCSDQVLFDYCTAKFADNTQCSVPVFDITHELPLCVEHARKRDNYNRMNQENKPKKVRKKVKPSAMIRPQKRSKKKKRSSPSKPTKDNVICENSSTYESCDLTPEFVQEEDMVEQVLAMQDDGQTDEALVNQASRLLEETDITNVLNTIHTEDFNDFFSEITVNRNGEYEPSREETEELERALAAVDNDVKSLEKLTQQGLLDSLLDEHTLVESLVQIPDVFHNGYAFQCGDASSSRLLAVDGLLPQTHTQS